MTIPLWAVANPLCKPVKHIAANLENSLIGFEYLYTYIYRRISGMKGALRSVVSLYCIIEETRGGNTLQNRYFDMFYRYFGILLIHNGKGNFFTSVYAQPVYAFFSSSFSINIFSENNE